MRSILVAMALFASALSLSLISTQSWARSGPIILAPHTPPKPLPPNPTGGGPVNPAPAPE